VAQALEAVIHNPTRQIARLRGHPIVGGLGKLGAAYALLKEPERAA